MAESAVESGSGASGTTAGAESSVWDWVGAASEAGAGDEEFAFPPPQPESSRSTVQRERVNAKMRWIFFIESPPLQ